ncbi:MAG TPA: ribulokinase [Bryobacteraceae bacterium]|nr:ribulokinase [Bryobacteraceae bacterium]
MSIVAGVDFGTLSVRVSIVDSAGGPSGNARGRIGSAVAEYPLHRKKEDPDFGTQSHQDHMRPLIQATQGAIAAAGIDAKSIEAIALDTTGSSVVFVDKNLEPIDDYYLWCDHRAWKEAAEITAAAHAQKLQAIDWCGGVYSSEWGWAKLLHWLRHNPEKRARFATALEHCDMVAATLCGITDPDKVPRSVCAMGHKWMWNASLGGLPPEDFLASLDPLLKGVRAKIAGRYETSDKIAGELSSEWASKLGLRAGIPIPAGAFDAHWDAVGAGVRLGDVVNVIGTATCIMAISESPGLIPGVCGVVDGSIDPNRIGVEAGLSATGDLFGAIAQRAGVKMSALAQGLDEYRAGETGLLRLTWDNGDRTVLVNPELGGVTFGWRLTTTMQDELFAAIEGCAMHTRVILERMAEHGVPVKRIIHGGGIPQKNPALNRAYANAMGKPILVPKSEVTSLGSAIFAFLAIGTFRSIEQAQDALCPEYATVEPIDSEARVYERLYTLYKKLYFALGERGSNATAMGDVLPELRSIAAEARAAKKTNARTTAS